jgi:uncharacterized iron-regulated membrane protein
MRILRKLHRWAGLALALPLILQGLSGAILALEPVLPAIGPSRVASGEPQPANRIVAAARAAVPDGLRPTRYMPAGSPDEPALVQFSAPAGPAGRAITVPVDPASLAIMANAQRSDGAIGWLRSFHTDLLMRDRGGRSVVGWIGVGLLSLALLGIPLWWPRPGQMRAAVTFERKAQGVEFYRRLHGAAGIWSVLLLLATSSSGAILAFPQTARSVLGLAPSSAGPTQRTPAPGDHPLPDIDAAMAMGRSSVPDARVRMVVLPARSDDPLRVMMTPIGAEGVAALAAVTIDATARRVVAVQDRRSLSTAEMALRWMHDLHFGQGFGLMWRASTIATGLVLPIFGITGGAVWLLRHRRRIRTSAMRGATPLAGE